MKMANKTDKHWVEELFPPRFGLTLDDILNDELPTDEDGDDRVTLPKAEPNSVFAKFARRISPLDVEAVKNVYERVWLMMQMKAEEERKKSAADVDSTGCRDASTSTNDPGVACFPDIQDPCIWNSEEISVLRSVFRATKEENSKLRGELNETREQFRELQERHKRERKENENPLKRLNEAKKANQRLSILSKNLKAQVESTTRQNDLLRKQLQDLKDEQKSALKENHKLRVAVDHERISRKKAELELQCHTREALREQKVHEEHLKMMHEEDIQFLQKTVEELTSELEKEKENHERTKRGLNHLQQHFSSLSLDGVDNKVENVVKEDQLKKWTY